MSRRRGLLLAATSIITGIGGAVTNIVTGQQVVQWWLVGLVVVLLALSAVLAYLYEREPQPATGPDEGSEGDRTGKDNRGGTGLFTRTGEVVHQHRHQYTRVRESPGPVNSLPAKLPGFIGRLPELTELRSRIGSDERTSATILAIDGMGGVGKTALAVHLAHELISHFPDGVLFLDMRAHVAGQDPYRPAEAIEALLLQVDQENTGIPLQSEALEARWRAELNSRRLLVVIDNVSDEEQVRPLLAGEGRSAILLTSRSRLSLPGIRSISLYPPPDKEAEEMFANALGDHAESGRREEISAVLRTLGNLPLAVILAATWMAHRPNSAMEELLNRLSSPHRAVEDMLELSYSELSDDLQRFARLIAHHPGTMITPPAAAALADLSLPRAEESLDDLYDLHLIEADERSSGQYRLHDLARSFLLEVSARTETAAQAEQALARLARAYYVLAKGTEAEDYVALDQDREGLLQVTERVVESGLLPWAWKLPAGIAPYLKMRGLARTGVDLCNRALAAMRPVRDRKARAHLHERLAHLLRVVANPREERTHLRKARRLALLSPDLVLAASIEISLDDHSKKKPRQDGPIAQWLSEKIYVRMAGESDPKKAGHALLQWGSELRRNRNPTRAEEVLEQASRKLIDAGDLHCASSALTRLARLQWHEGDFDKARHTVSRALTCSTRLGCSYCTAMDELMLADYQRNGGDDEAAKGHLRTAISIFSESGAVYDQFRAILRLADLHHRLGERAAAEAALEQAAGTVRTDDWSLQATVHRRRASYAADTGDMEAAQRDLSAAFGLLTIIDGPDARDDRAHTYLDMAALMRRTGDIEEADRIALRALVMFQELEQVECQVAAHRELAEINEAAGDIRRAEKHRRKEKELREFSDF
ncbi:ATP-binding protein [Nocardiopsis protaetiae]|uniref:ATP-binding protein n=1 Tax=Nocardiopsis protaetiae TaxID=3382270 RepID=UPI00387AFCBE